ncbi:3-oxoacyl-ACP synthase III family protein [Streptomyces kebangsaanensis]|uniref:3-oxoacyl-ACP synthase III family protein n=1 Tax=Streptomyces kebangsaanensis TaxID=864058 RepID=UPI00093A638D|nr:ketoacyl-ACP synthase III [Streptomyces kebangsaanensis]
MSPTTTSAPSGSRIGVLGIGSYLPSQVITNDMLADRAGVTEEWIVRKTGIVARRAVKPDEATSDLAVYAARAALEDAGISPSQLSLVVVGTATPDMAGPSVASLTALALECPTTTGTFDIQAACAGFLTAVDMASTYLSVRGGYALVIGADTYSRFRNHEDRRTTALWGDGAGAVVLGPVDDGSGLLATRITSFPVDTEVGGIPAGGSRLPASHETVDAGLHFVRMNGRRIMEIFQEHIPPMTKAFLDDAGQDLEDVDHVVPHQGNQRMVESLPELLGFTRPRLHASAHDFGNTGSASIPVTLDRAVRQGRIRSGESVLMVSIGAGMTFGFALLRWK